jgi:hypothetical protein
MCFPFLFFSRKTKNFIRKLECSCELCGKVFDDMESLIKHMGFHETHQINTILTTGFGTVRCNKCWTSFKTVFEMADHPCATVIEGLSPVTSSDDLSSVLIHH